MLETQSVRATYDDIVQELLHDGIQVGNEKLGLLVAVGAYATSPVRPSAGPRFAPGSRLPWSGAATSLRLDFERDVHRLHRQACVEVFGHDRPMGSLAATINHLALLVGMVSPDLASATLKHFQKCHRRALVLLEEERPSRRVPDMHCPYCFEDGTAHAVMLEPGEGFLHDVRRIFCTGCPAEWSLETSGLLARMQEASSLTA